MPASEDPTLAEGLVATLVRLAARAMPGLENARCDGWALRASRGVSARGNSVVTLRYDGDDVVSSVEQVERWYARRGLAARFQMSPATRPAGLDALLGERGYARAGAATMAVATLPLGGGADGGRAGARPVAVLLSGDARHGWVTAHAAGTGMTREASRVVADLGMVAPGATVFASAQVGDEVVGVGRATVEDGWVGVFTIATLVSARRGGVARAVLAALAAWAYEQGATRAYLQAEADQAAAGLVQAAGFEPAFEYWYRVRAEPPGPTGVGRWPSPRRG